MSTTVNPPDDAVNKEVDGAAAVEDSLAAVGGPSAGSNVPPTLHHVVATLKPPPAMAATTVVDANAAAPCKSAASMKAAAPGKKTAQPGRKNNKRKSVAPPEEEVKALGVVPTTTPPPPGIPMIPRLPTMNIPPLPPSLGVVPTVAGSTTISATPALCRASDAEFVRMVASELKRRGYKLAMRFETDLSQEDDDDDEEEGGDGEDRKVASKKKPRTSSMMSSNPTSQGGRKQPTPLALPTFQFYPSTVCVSEKNAETWNIMFGRMKSYYDENNGSLPVADIALYLHATSKKTPATVFNTGSAYHKYSVCETIKTASPDNNVPAGENGLDVALYKWTKAQITLWKRMKKDSRHNLSLDRIAMLHSLDFDRAEAMSRDVRTRVLLDESAATLVSGGATKAAVNLDDDDDDDEDDGGGGVSNNKGLKLAKPGRNALKWHTKFEMLRQYHEVHGDTNVPRTYDDKLSKVRIECYFPNEHYL